MTPAARLTKLLNEALALQRQLQELTLEDEVHLGSRFVGLVRNHALIKQEILGILFEIDVLCIEDDALRYIGKCAAEGEVMPFEEDAFAFMSTIFGAANRDDYESFEKSIIEYYNSDVETSLLLEVKWEDGSTEHRYLGDGWEYFAPELDCTRHVSRSEFLKSMKEARALVWQGEEPEAIIHRIFGEARLCFAYRNYMAACAMARSALEVPLIYKEAQAEKSKNPPLNNSERLLPNLAEMGMCRGENFRQYTERLFGGKLSYSKQNDIVDLWSRLSLFSHGRQIVSKEPAIELLGSVYKVVKELLIIDMR